MNFQKSSNLVTLPSTWITYLASREKKFELSFLTIPNFIFDQKYDTALSLSPSNELLFYASETNKIAQLSTPHRDASVTFATRCLYVSYLDKYLMESRPLQKPSHFYDFSSTGFRERATAAFCRHLRTKWEVFECRKIGF